MFNLIQGEPTNVSREIYFDHPVEVAEGDQSNLNLSQAFCITFSKRLINHLIGFIAMLAHFKPRKEMILRIENSYKMSYADYAEYTCCHWSIQNGDGSQELCISHLSRLSENNMFQQTHCVR